jgi:uncharacterized protein (DUF608 family)
LSTCDCGAVDRRTFIQWTAAGAAALASSPGIPRAIAGPFATDDVRDHFVPADKKLTTDWLKTLFDKGQPTWYAGRDLETIGMPVGGICAGQVYLTGDGRLVHWDIFNQHIFTGYGRDNYALGRKADSPLTQGFAIQIETGEQTIRRTLDADGFPGVRFRGEYPIGMIQYASDDVPLSIDLEAFSPFVPLNAVDSALPATLMEFSLHNKSEQAVEVTLAGWLENAVCLHSGQGLYGMRRNQVHTREGLAVVESTARAVDPPTNVRAPIVLADFEGGGYDTWTVEGEAFGGRPAGGTLEKQQTVSGFLGKGLVNTYLGGSDTLQGKLTSPPFAIERSFLCFLIGGGSEKGKTCINLIVDDQIVRTATGMNKEKLVWNTWDVREYAGKQARIEIVDAASGPWGHINIDQIEMRDQPQPALRGELESQADFGSMALALLSDGPDIIARAALPAGRPAETVFATVDTPDASRSEEKPFGEMLCGSLAERIHLPPGETRRVTFAVTWCFPNHEVRGEQRGNFYARRFNDALSVTRYLAEHNDRLAGQTRLWHQTWYDSTLPHWLLDRLFSTTSTLATSTCQWWGDGRFWAWEGVGCCHGTCTHVWNYEHTMARLFPQLERSAREMQDYAPAAGFVEETGMIRFRGEDWGGWAGDGQAGTVLKAYREHQVSTDNAFLARNWSRIKKSLQFLINEDGNGDGVLEGSQHNTYDINFIGPNTMVGSLYLAALRAGQEMALEMGDDSFAEQCGALFEAGSEASVERLFDGEYFVQQVDLAKHPKHQYGDGCLSDQLFGQGWAHQVGLGYVYPRQQIDQTLASIWKYNWTPDVGPQNEAHPPERWFARPGEAGLFTCTWPKSPHLTEGVRYKNEIWTGIEYQVAGNMAWEGLVTEALAICRGVHERYHPSKHNPWNEIECGDHYARGMASYGVFLGLCGFEYHGPKKHLGFAPRITPDNFRGAFTAAAAWGSLRQTREPTEQQNRIEVVWGTLPVRSLRFDLPAEVTHRATQVTCGGRDLDHEVAQDGQRLVIRLKDELVAREGDVVQVKTTI